MPRTFCSPIRENSTSRELQGSLTHHPRRLNCVSYTSTSCQAACHCTTDSGTVSSQPPGLLRGASSGGQGSMCLPGHGLRDGPWAHRHLDSFLPFLSPGIRQHVVLIGVQLVGVMQLHGSDQVSPKHLGRRRGHWHLVSAFISEHWQLQGNHGANQNKVTVISAK